MGMQEELKPAMDDRAEQDKARLALRHMFGRGMLYAAFFALQSAAMIVITPLTVRNLSKYQFGRLVTALTLVQLLMPALTFGLGTAIQRLHSDDDDEFRDTRGLLGVGICLALTTTVLIDLTGPLWTKALRLGPYGTTLKYGVWVAGLAAIVMLIAQLFRSEDRLGAFSTVMLMLAVFSQLAGLLFILAVHHNASSYLEGVCVGELLSVIVAIGLSRPRLLWIGKRRLVYAALALALPLVPNGIASQALNLGDRIVVQHKLGEFAVGRYQLAYNASAIVMLALQLLSQAWLPRIFAIKDDSLRRLILAESRDEIYRLLVPLMIGISLAAPIALRILAPPSYNTNSLLLVVSLVAISAAPFAAYVSSTRVLIVFGRTRSLLWATPAAAAINVALNVVLVPLWGINASALATFLGYGVLAIMSGISSRQLAQLPRTPQSVWVSLVLASGASLAIVLIPASPIYLGIRSILSLLCAAWTVVYIMRLIRGTERPRHARRWILMPTPWDRR
jgi:O-antigen/teichoic acid export membrane protein